ncbi:carbohydrate ABC transporter permease [Stackebrandtia nassauensis]|uniref:Binding-protein-dependent transport systems inner membrane component n=1 Tax=Stackebrandtia nassauensis (strain DSM 44728 / CIP 108903 / NRRL B-16338 / NBRC 102104 / LLR-40K-21) TaxID=446470 RepID=D3QAL1_STANL|nr:ABC transporter permease subunit [Stackebrandtia nassauensis]ADD42794.1 binding-protein-dependent transport systems inner membrane component [Stackebrandtia nassauensis DSM 44728]
MTRDRAQPRAPITWLSIVGYLLALVTALPILWMVLAAFRPKGDVFALTWPTNLTTENFTYVLTEVPFPVYLGNSALVSIVVTVIALFLHTMAGYALARLRFPGRGLAFGLVIATLLISLPVILVPLFMVTEVLGMVNTYAGLIVPSIFNAFGVFLLRQFYLSLPTDLEDAGRLDGCGHLRLYWHIVLPLSRPIMASLAVLFFLANWNSFVWPLTVAQDENLRVVQVGINSLQGQYGQDYQYVLAGSVLAAIPTVIVFLIGQRRIVDSLKTTGLK